MIASQGQILGFLKSHAPTGNACWKGDVPPPATWEAVSTNLGDIGGSIQGESAAIRVLLNSARAATGKVVVLPEGIVPRWSLFRESELAQLRGKTVLFGAQTGVRDSDFEATIRALNMKEAPPTSQARNFLVTVTSQGIRTLDQHIPVPLAMWKPLGAGGVRMTWRPNVPVEFGGERATLLICYEALIPWPVLTSMPTRPTLLVAIANDYWTAGSTVGRHQAAVLKCWSRLFGLPFLRASNR